MLPSGHLGHNKFLVVCAPDGTPQAAWTGSTNWTKTGLCTQVNNAVLITDPAVAQAYRNQWEALAAAGDAQPPDLKASDEQPHQAAVGDRQVTIWYAPSAPAAGDYPDLADARRYIAGAKQGILFLMFMPGTHDTLLDAIMGRASAAPNLYVRGVLNQDPGTAQNPSVGLFHRNQWHVTNLDVVLPAAIPQAFSAWEQELRQLPGTHAMVHSKAVVIDPFGDHPVVITGSHNMGPRASGANDENLVFVEGDAGLAQDYAVNVMVVYNQYSWRYHRGVPDQIRAVGEDPLAGTSAAGDGAGTGAGTNGGGDPAAASWKSLEDDDTWQDVYFRPGSDQRELAFWLGQAQ
jgi:phosphatidylserine/phosphatidylglycerophosphate/cardiolipin synthase-like enzyme